MSERIRVVVVGAGVMGLSAAWALARAGARPLVLERFARGHTRGASHGTTRNFNDAYTEDRYLDLLARARAAWAVLGTPGGEPVLRLHGIVTRGPAGVLETVHAALAERGIDARLLDAAEAARRWPGIRFAGPALVSEDAGVVRADAALAELERRIVALGGEVRYSAPVRRIEDRGDDVRIDTDGGGIVADVAVVAVGAWTRPLLGGLVPLPRLTVTEESPAHFVPLRPNDPWPSFNHLTAGLGDATPGDVYGMPSPGEGVKVGFHRVGPEVDPDARPFRATHVAALEQYVREWMPGLDPATARPISCTYTSTDSGAFVLDRAGRIVVGAGFSGHGFKFAAGIGEVLADLADAEPGAAVTTAFPLPAP
ncbi:FAD-dependent oxidoreductase [Microbacterium sp. 18062]|uniref:FAD-dependent oxidoreductase n=1 Tax=Microbacterium sp. 18062 TaxID=2681410 RepID=UPI0013596344|nr:FAD-dependent oxidoreductase [Microbacterium sp. 18062]